MGKEVLVKYIFEKEKTHTAKVYDEAGVKRTVTFTVKPLNRPIGCVVAIAKDKIGVSLLNPLDRGKVLEKKALRERAILKAKAGAKIIVPEEYQHYVDSMKERSGRYFR